MDPETTLQPDPPPTVQPPVTLPEQPPDWGPLSEETLDEWRWLYKAGAEGALVGCEFLFMRFKPAGLFDLHRWRESRR
jgi:hypothetical protein